MSACDTCPIEEKIHVCCARYPRTGEQALMILDDGTEIRVCPHLGKDGRCRIYSTRPEGCKQFFCERFSLERSMRAAEENEGYKFLEKLINR